MSGAGTLVCLGEGLYELGLDQDDDEPVAGYGGDVANVAVMAARLGAYVRLGGRVGDDPLGRRLLAFWRQVGIETDHVIVDQQRPTGLYVNELGPDGHRFTYLRRASAGSALCPADVDDALLAGVQALHFSGITLAVSASSAEAAAYAARSVRARGSLVSMAVNHRPALGGRPEQIAEAARSADVVFVSDEESTAVFGAEDPVALAAALAGAEVVVTHGAAGATWLRAGADAIRVPAPAVEAVDAAGAGDALAGAYLAMRLSGADPGRSLAVGVAAAALSCRRRGCGRGYPTLAEVQAVAR